MTLSPIKALLAKHLLNCLLLLSFVSLMKRDMVTGVFPSGVDSSCFCAAGVARLAMAVLIRCKLKFPSCCWDYFPHNCCLSAVKHYFLHQKSFLFFLSSAIFSIRHSLQSVAIIWTTIVVGFGTLCHVMLCQITLYLNPTSSAFR